MSLDATLGIGKDEREEEIVKQQMNTTNKSLVTVGATEPQEDTTPTQKEFNEDIKPVVEEPVSSTVITNQSAEMTTPPAVVTNQGTVTTTPPVVVASQSTMNTVPFKKSKAQVNVSFN